MFGTAAKEWINPLTVGVLVTVAVLVGVMVVPGLVGVKLVSEPDPRITNALANCG